VMCLTADRLLKDRYFEGVNAAILIGGESTAHWSDEMEKEAGRLNLPLYRTAIGDICCAYAAPDDLIALIRGAMTTEFHIAS